jgi:lipopolysaccharide/colanic/teichoic acid biosynthesis glycosyltransferase
MVTGSRKKYPFIRFFPLYDWSSSYKILNNSTCTYDCALEKEYGNYGIYSRFFKIFFDILFSVLSIFILFPLLFIAGVAIYIEDPRSVFYRQSRVAFNDKVFYIIKLRSMYLNTEKKAQWAEPHDPRITRVGRFLRQVHWDEIPQFFNILKGHMSIVDPCPK